MPQLGFQEMIVILVIALLVFGPKKLPELGKSLGKGIREFKKATNDLKANWEDHIREAQTAVEDVKQDVKQTIHEASKEPTEGVAQTATASTVQTDHAKEVHNAPSN
jgi:sec-independent protein translocase protein TatA